MVGVKRHRGSREPGTHTGHTGAHRPDPDRHTVSYFAGTPERTSVSRQLFHGPVPRSLLRRLSVRAPPLPV